MTYYQALAEIDHPERLLPIGWHRTPGGVFSYGPLPGRFDNVNRFFGDMMSGLYYRYDFGSDQDEVGQLIGDKPIQLIEGEASLYDLMQDGNGVLLDATKNSHASKVALATSKRIRCVPTDYRLLMLIRPDACIAWIGNNNSIDGLKEALHLWFPSLVSNREMTSEQSTALSQPKIP